MQESQRTIDVAPLDLRADVGAVHEDSRTVELTFSTGAAVQRFDWITGQRYMETLSMDPKHIRMQRLQNGAPLLNAHSAYTLADQIGVVERAEVDGKKGTATVRFSKRADVDGIFNDVKDKIVRNVSVGYRVHAFEETPGKGNGIPTRKAVDWEPYEISMVPMGADSGARVRSSKDVETNPCEVRVIEERTMSNPETPATPATPTVPAVDEAAVRTAASADEKARITGIQKAVRVAKLGDEFAADLVARNVTLDAARAAIFEKLAEAEVAQPNTTNIRMGEDAVDKWARGAQAWLLIRSGLAAMVGKYEKSTTPLDAGEFRGMSLIDMARESLERAGVKTRGMSRMDLAGKAMSYRSNYQTPSDFTTLLENTMYKVLRAAYGITPDTWSRFCATGTVSDFRTHNWYRTGALSELDSLNDVGEFKNKSIPDGEKATYSVGTKGNIIAISRQTIVNDDLGAVMQLTQRLGRAGKLTIEKMVYALLAQNSGLGPTYGSAPLFDDSAHGNVSTGAAISAAAIDADRVKMALQKEPNSNEYADLRPSILLVPVGLGGVARIINTSQYDPDTLANKSQMKPNVVSGLFADIVDSPRVTAISTTRRYLFANPSIAPVLMVSFLEGQQEPILETQDGWRVDGVELKARLDVGVDAVDYRGAVTNAGT